MLKLRHQENEDFDSGETFHVSDYDYNKYKIMKLRQD